MKIEIRKTNQDSIVVTKVGGVGRYSSDHYKAVVPVLFADKEGELEIRGGMHDGMAYSIRGKIGQQDIGDVARHYSDAAKVLGMEIDVDYKDVLIEFHKITAAMVEQAKKDATAARIAKLKVHPFLTTVKDALEADGFTMKVESAEKLVETNSEPRINAIKNGVQVHIYYFGSIIEVVGGEWPHKSERKARTYKNLVKFANEVVDSVSYSIGAAKQKAKSAASFLAQLSEAAKAADPKLEVKEESEFHSYGDRHGKGYYVSSFKIYYPLEKKGQYDPDSEPVMKVAEHKENGASLANVVGISKALTFEQLTAVLKVVVAK